MENFGSSAMVCIPLELCNAKDIPPEYLLIYIYLVYGCTGKEYNVDFREINKLSGIAIPKISRALKYFENRGLIFIRRSKNNLYVTIAPLPDVFIKTFSHRVNDVMNQIKLKSIIRKEMNVI